MSRPDPHPIYTAFLNSPLCQLTDEDREHLMTYRGFSAEFIASARYRSARPENAQIIAELQQQFGRDELIDAGLLTVHEGNVQPNRQLIELGRPILIPYRCDAEPNGPIYHLRPHKLGFKNVPIQFYCAGNSEEIVLAESEFKADASYCLGFASVGIPGISSFCREHFDRLMKHISDNHITRVTICFDNEIKNDPDLPNYKTDPEKRWDTPYYAALMALRIHDNASYVETFVATLPDAWRVNGKIDIDGALAAGHTNEEFAGCIGAALRVEDYIDSLPEEAQVIVRRKIRSFYLSLRIRRTIKGYEVYDKDDAGLAEWKPISNFTFKIMAKLETQNEGIVRLVRMKQGMHESDPFKIDAGDMVKPDNFQQAFYRNGTGEAWYKGSKEQLIDIFDLEHTNGPMSVVVEPDHVGKIAGKDMWLFGDNAIIGGKVVNPDSNRIFWNGVKGYTLPQFTGGEADDGSVSRLTSRVPRPDFTPGHVDLKEIAVKLFENFGGHDGGHNAVAAMCWALATSYSHDFFEEFGVFPILYLRGLKETGKSTLARWLLRFFGVMHPGFNAGGSLPGISRAMAYYSSLPVFIDECRDETIAETRKESFFRSAYDRQPLLKADGPQGTKVASLPIRSTVMMAGEHSPKDPALQTRCVFVDFSADRKGFGCNYDWLDEHSRTTFPKVLPWVIQNGPAALNLVDEAKTFRKLLQGQEVGIDPRAARNYSMLIAIYNSMIDPQDEMGIANSLMNMAKRSHEDQREDNDLTRFFEDLSFLRDVAGTIKHNQDYKIDGGLLLINLRHCWEAWQKRKKDIGEKVPNSQTALALIRGVPFFAHSNQKNTLWHLTRLGGTPQKCIGIYLDKAKGCPECLIDFAMPVGM